MRLPQAAKIAFVNAANKLQETGNALAKVFQRKIQEGMAELREIEAQPYGYKGMIENWKTPPKFMGGINCRNCYWSQIPITAEHSTSSGVRYA